ncbi:hypothetical protein HY383_04600 [Candidatus Daviesbacteria bacterium]|nr:hypothetical protein [Candidatus Daviesbacteria bacterium]
MTEFSPQQAVGELLQNQTSRNRTTVEAVKQQIIDQKIGLANAQQQIVGIIAIDPDADLPTLQLHTQQLLAPHNPSQEQKDFANAVLTTYHDIHSKIKILRQEYPADQELVKALFGFIPKGTTQAIQDPISFYIRFASLDDFVRAYRGNPTEELRGYDYDKAKAVQAFTCERLGQQKELEGFVMIENAGFFGIRRRFDPHTNERYQHEHQHVVDFLFEKATAEPIPWGSTRGLERYRRSMEMHKRFELDFRYAKTAEERKDIILKFARAKRKTLTDANFKKELLAFTQEGTSVGHISRMMFLPAFLSGYKRFLNEDRQFLRDLIPAIIGSQYQELGAQITKQVYDKEFMIILKQALDSIKLLRQLSFTDNQITSILMHEDMDKWYKTTTRIQKARQNR